MLPVSCGCWAEWTRQKVCCLTWDRVIDAAIVPRLFLPRGKDAEELINREPALLFVSLDTVVRDIRRLMPKSDPRTVGFKLTSLQHRAT